MASNFGSYRVKCPIMECCCTFDVGSRHSSSVLRSIEIFDPSQNTQAQECPNRRLNVGRYSCGTFAVTANVMCVLGGKDHKNEYLSSVEMISDTSVQIRSDMFSLPVPMA